MGFGWAKIGAKVVCIKRGEWTRTLPWEAYPKYGETYTINGIQMDGGHLTLTFHEIYNVSALWVAYQFRPLITLESDISMFTALTNMSPVERLDRLKEMMDQ